VAAPRPGSILELVEEALSVLGERLRALADRARAGGDDELVHDVRVTLRRLEALSRLFRSVPAARDGEAVREAASALRRRLSLVRSEEVGRALIAARTDGAGGALETVVFPGKLPGVRVAATDLEKAGEALTGWKRKLSAAFDGAFAPRADAESVLLRQTRRRLRRRLAEVAALLPPRRRTLHAARIAAKRARYTLEVVEPLDPGVTSVLRLLRSFQVAAGDAHDLLELVSRVRAVAGSDPDAGPFVGPLLRTLEADADRAFSAARRRGAALDRPVRRLRPALRRPESR
jgi:CHAD domain-containing protein